MQRLCKSGGGNDYVCCILCGVEYNPMKGEKVPKCQAHEKLDKLIKQKNQLLNEITDLIYVLAMR